VKTVSPIFLPFRKINRFAKGHFCFYIPNFVYYNTLWNVCQAINGGFNKPPHKKYTKIGRHFKDYYVSKLIDEGQKKDKTNILKN